MYGVSIANDCPSISHLFFADDTLLFFKATSVECEVIREILDKYEKMSGQVIHLQKLTIVCRKNTSEEMRTECTKLLGIERVEKHAK